MQQCLMCHSKQTPKAFKKVNGWVMNKCPDCRGDFALPSNKPDKNALPFYDNREYLVGYYLSWAHRDFLKYAPAGLSLLDIGAGTGDFIHNAIEKGYGNVTGIEMDSRAVAAGNTHWSFNKLITADALTFLRGTNATWDNITLFAVLEHLEDPNILFQEILKHLNTGGHVTICVQNMGNLYAWLWSVISPGNDYPPNHYTRWTKKSLDMFLQRYNMEVVYRSTCAPSLVDIIPDLIKIGDSRWYNYFCLLASPFELLLRKISKEGRAQMVIVKRIEE